MLTSIAPSTSMSNSRLPSPIMETDDNSNKLSMYLQQLAGNCEMEVDIIIKDHCYARPWNWRPENIYVKPVKRLFFSKNTSDKHRKDEEIDVEDTDSESLILPFDLARARYQMDEFQRLASFARPEEDEDWEEKIDKTLFSSAQHRIFTKVTRILNSERLARLAKAKNGIEPIFRRSSVDIASRRFRETLASTGWDCRLVQWLHSLLFEHLSQEYLAIYLDILQTLRLKIPLLIDKMIAVQPNINAKAGSITWEMLGSLLKRSWDPVTPSLNGNRLKKLPGNPILIIVPTGVTSVSSRQHKWIAQLGSLGMVATVHTHLGLTANRMTMLVLMDQLVQATRAKIQDVRSDCPGRPIILVGFNTGATLACQVAQMEYITAVICIGFPLNTVEGKRGTPDDTMIDIRCPVMFVIGQNATLVRPDDLEDMREKMLVETSLIVVGTADDHLRISTSKKLLEGITQSMVDRCILNEIGDFIGSILLQPHPLPLRSSTMTNCDNKTKKDKHRNSTSSSMESEPNSPIKRSQPNTPVSTAISVGTNATSTAVPKIDTFSTQANLVHVGGQHINHTPNLKRKRTTNSQKNQLANHVKSPKLSGQTSINTENGITLNIGKLASLAPIGPICLRPNTVGPSASTPLKTSGTSKSSSAPVKIPKISSTNIQTLQGVSKMKTIVSNKTLATNVISHNYRQVNVPDKSGDTKMMNVLTASGSQIRVNTTTGVTGTLKPVASSGTLSNLLQSGKSSITLTNASSVRVSSASSILLTTSNSPANNITSSTPKAMEETGMSDSHHATLSSTHLLDVSKSACQLPRQGAAPNSSDNVHNTCGNIVIIENSLHNRGAPSSSTIVPFNSQNSDNILPLSSNKIKISHKSVKAMPKITVNANNLQRLQQKGKTQSIQKKSPANDINNDLGNILDIPIIFAKDDDNLNNIDKISVVTQTTTAKESQERPKLNSTTTKVVLISNKQDKAQQSQHGKLGASSSQTVLCPTSIPMQNLNHLILQTRSQNSDGTSAKNKGIGILMKRRLMQVPDKYAKIILAKRNAQSFQQSKKSEQIIATKALKDLSAPKILTFEENENRYVQASSNSFTNYEDVFMDNVLEIEDAIKTNIIERKFVSTPTIDSLTSVTPDDNCNISQEMGFDQKECDSEQPAFEDDISETPSSNL